MNDEHKSEEFVPKGVSNRNRGLEVVIEIVESTGDDSGVIYFADDDNTYHPDLFEEVYCHCTFLLGYFHLIGVIFTPWGKIYPFKGKMKLAPFCTVFICNFWRGFSNTM